MKELVRHAVPATYATRPPAIYLNFVKAASAVICQCRIAVSAQTPVSSQAPIKSNFGFAIET